MDFEKLVTEQIDKVKQFGFVTTAETDLEALERVLRQKGYDYLVQRSYQGHLQLTLA